MKKIFAILLCMTLILSLCACTEILEQFGSSEKSVTSIEDVVGKYTDGSKALTLYDNGKFSLDPGNQMNTDGTYSIKDGIITLHIKLGAVEKQIQYSVTKKGNKMDWEIITDLDFFLDKTFLDKYNWILQK